MLLAANTRRRLDMLLQLSPNTTLTYYRAMSQRMTSSTEDSLATQTPGCSCNTCDRADHTSSLSLRARVAIGALSRSTDSRRFAVCLLLGYLYNDTSTSFYCLVMIALQLLQFCKQTVHTATNNLILNSPILIILWRYIITQYSPTSNAMSTRRNAVTGTV